MENRFDAADTQNLANLIDDAAPSPGAPIGEGPGTRVGRYKLLQLIGEGGFGSVFMAEQVTPVVRRVALKIIKLGMDTRQVIARFEAERQALAMMDHPNIAKVLDAAATETGRPYFVMELVPGVPITQYCDRKRLTPRQRIELFVPVCRAVQHAHQKGIIHRDLKPSNILVMICDAKPVPKVIDFGVAKALHQRLTEKTLFTQFGGAVGTLEYMSPEQADMDVLGADTRSDVYSLGVLLYELLTGATPLDRARLREAGYAQMLRMIREEEPVPPSTRLTQSGDALASISAARGTEARELTRLTAGDLDWIVMKCLEKDRARRYETADGLARDLERYLHDEPVEASPPSPGDKLRRFARKHRFGLSVAAGFAIVLLLATALSSWQAVRATHAKADALAAQGRADAQFREAATARQAAELNLADALIAQGDALGAASQWGVAKQQFQQAIDLLRANEQSSFVAEVAFWDANRRSPSPLMEYAAHRGEVTHLRFLPGGEQLATVGSDGVGRLWETRTGRPIRTFPGLGDVQRLSVSPDGKRIAFASTSTGVTTWRIADGTLALTIRGLGGRASAISFSPDGRSVLVGCSDPPYDLYLFDAASGALVRKFIGHRAAVRDVAFTPDGSKAVSCDGRPPGDKLGFGYSTSIRTWDVAAGRPLWFRRADEWRLVGALAVAPNGTQVASTSWDGACDVWDIASSTQLFSLPSEHGRDVQGVAYSARGLLAVGSGAGTIAVFLNHREVKRFAGHVGETRTLDFSPDGRFLASGGGDGMVRIWPVYAGGETRTFPETRARTIVEIRSVRLSPDARLALSSSEQDRMVRLWDLASGAELGRVETANGFDASAAFGPGDGAITLIEQDGRIGVWDQALQRRRRRIEPPAGRTFDSLALSPDGQTLLACFADGSDAAVYHTDSGEMFKSVQMGDAVAGTHPPAEAFAHRDEQNRRFVFSPDGTFAVGFARDTNTVKIWRTADWRERHSLPVPRPTRAAISADSKWVACVGADVRVYDVRSGQLRTHFDEAADQISAVAFLPDPRYLVTEGAPGEGLVLWDLSRNTRVRPIGRGSYVFDLAISADGTMLWAQQTGAGALNMARFDWTSKFDALATGLARDRETLQGDPNNAPALTDLARWYAFRGVPDWAVQMLDRAGRPAGAARLLDVCQKQAATENAPAGPNLSTRPDLSYPAVTDWFVNAIRHTSLALANDPSDAALLLARGRIYARTGLFAQAAADLSKAMDLAPNDHMIWSQGMPLLLELGKLDEYRARRSKALRRFASAEGNVADRMAKSSMMAPGSPEEMSIALTLADRALAVNPAESWFWFCKGLAEYRCGHDLEAIRWLAKLSASGELRQRAAAEFYFAMALQRLGGPAEARAAFDRGVAIMENMLPKAALGDLSEENFQNWILCDVARKEARTIITGAPSTRPNEGLDSRPAPPTGGRGPDGVPRPTAPSDSSTRPAESD